MESIIQNLVNKINNVDDLVQIYQTNKKFNKLPMEKFREIKVNINMPLKPPKFREQTFKESQIYTKEIVNKFFPNMMVDVNRFSVKNKTYKDDDLDVYFLEKGEFVNCKLDNICMNIESRGSVRKAPQLTDMIGIKFNNCNLTNINVDNSNLLMEFCNCQIKNSFFDNSELTLILFYNELDNVSFVNSCIITIFKGNYFINTDFSDSVITEYSEIDDCNFMFCNFENIIFMDDLNIILPIKKCIFMESSFQNANFGCSVLIRSSIFDFCILNESKNFQNISARFIKCIMKSISFGIEQYIDSKFELCDISQSNFTKCMINSEFIGCIMSNCDFTDSDLFGSRFIDSNLDNSIFHNVITSIKTDIVNCSTENTFFDNKDTQTFTYNN
jgi:uncharacterized protein YjbI with pentapeptide repeats